VIAVSQAVAEALKNQNIFSPEKIITIHNGIDLTRFDRSQESPNAKVRLRIGTIGHLAPIKGLEDFIRAAAIVSETHDDADFIIVGEDKSRSGENRAAIERLIRELNLEQRVQLTGWIDDVPQMLATLDLFVSPARAEPFGLAIVEAMAAGVPVIATAS